LDVGKHEQHFSRTKLAKNGGAVGVVDKFMKSFKVLEIKQMNGFFEIKKAG
jgi:hypothetical protein